MTDEQMDARLRNAGEAWRAATAPADDITPIEPQSLSTPDMPRPRRHRTGLLASAAIVAAALVAGGTALVANISGGKHDIGADTSPLERTVWQFVGYGDHLDSHSLSALYISPDGQLVADDECEVISAHVDSAAGTLDISQIAERFKQCTDTSEPAFSQGIDVLKSTPTYAIDSIGLTIGTGANALHFTPSTDLPAPTLDVPTFTDTNWLLVSATDPNGNVSPVEGKLLFRVEDGRFTADEGCNKLSGEVTEQGSQADIKNVDSTALPCPSPQPYEEVMQAVFQPGGVEASVLGAEFTIGRAGAGRLTYQWVPSDADATDPGALIGHDWTLASIAGVAATGNVGLYASKTDLSVTYGCGAVGGVAKVGQGTMHVAGIHDGAAPGCTGDLGDESTTVDSILANDPLWRVADGKLIISDASGAQGFALVFESPEAPQPTDVALTGTNWALVKIFDADKTELPVASDASLHIDSANHLSGSDGCNSISGDVTVDKSTIGFGNGLAITEMACTDDRVTATATFVDGILKGDVSWSIDGDELALTKDGSGTLVYRAGEAPKTSTDPADLIDKAWKLTTIETGGGAAGVASTPNGENTLTISLTEMTRTQDCMLFRGGVDVGAGTLDIDEQAFMNPACEPGGEVDERVGSVLNSGHDTWQIVGDQLTITKPGVGTLTYTGGAAAPAAKLIGSPWTLISIESDGVSHRSDTGVDDRVVLTLRDDGPDYDLVATACHSYVGTRTVVGMTITFRETADTRLDMAADGCTATTLAEGLREFLSQPVDWSIDDHTLTLTRGNTRATLSA